VLVVRFHFRPAQLIEFHSTPPCAAAAVCTVIWHSLTLRKRRETNWPHPPLFITQSKDRTAVKSAFEHKAIVLGYDVHGKPWLWPDATRIMQAVVCGATGSGKTTLLRNIITQDLFRTWGSRERPRHGAIIVDGKADSEYLAALPAIKPRAACTSCVFSIPPRPDISVRYNPFFLNRACTRARKLRI
jgi:hypothetical protein